MPLKTKYVIAGLIVAVVIVASLFGYYYFLAPKPEEVAVRLGIAHPKESLNFATYYVAVERNLFNKYGVKLSEVSEIAGGTGAVVAALAAKSIDVGVLMGIGVPSAVAKGMDIRVVAVLYPGFANSMLVFVPPDSPVKTLDDLKGKSIAVSKPGSLTHMNALIISHAKGFKPDDIKVVPLGSLDAILAGLKKHSVDASLWTLEVALTLEEKGEVRVIYPASHELYPRLKEWPGTVIVASKGFIEKHPSAVKKIVSAFLEANKIWNEEEGYAISLIKREYGLSDKVARTLYKNFYSPLLTDGRISVAGIEDTIRFLVEAGAMKEPIPAKEVYVEGFVPIVT